MLISDRKNGFLTKVNDRESLSRLMKNILTGFDSDKLYKISKEARKRANEFNERKINEMWYIFLLKIKNNSI